MIPSYWTAEEPEVNENAVRGRNDDDRLVARSVENETVRATHTINIYICMYTIICKQHSILREPARDNEAKSW
jgi:hypothetical protein